jgi:hypothetical protein
MRRNRRLERAAGGGATWFATYAWRARDVRIDPVTSERELSKWTYSPNLADIRQAFQDYAEPEVLAVEVQKRLRPYEDTWEDKGQFVRGRYKVIFRRTPSF